MIKTSEEFGQALQQIIDRHRQDLSILLGEYGYDENITPADLVMLYRRDHPMLLLTMSDLPLNDDDLCHMEGETTLDKLGSLFSKGMDLFGKVQDVANDVAGTPSGSGGDTQVQEPATKTSKTKIFIIVGVVIVIVLTLVLIQLKKRR